MVWIKATAACRLARRRRVRSPIQLNALHHGGATTGPTGLACSPHSSQHQPRLFGPAGVTPFAPLAPKQLTPRPDTVENSAARLRLPMTYLQRRHEIAAPRALGGFGACQLGDVAVCGAQVWRPGGRVGRRAWLARVLARGAHCASVSRCMHVGWRHTCAFMNGCVPERGARQAVGNRVHQQPLLPAPRLFKGKNTPRLTCTQRPCAGSETSPARPVRRCMRQAARPSRPPP